MTLIDEIIAADSEMRAIRHDIHAHPELGYEVHRTADLVASRLQAWGVVVTRGVGKTGIVGTLRQGGSSRSIGLRADMDALPLNETNGFGHRSTVPGCMHACGHDGHTAMLLGAARYLAQHRSFDGTVHFVFQPAEEQGGGALAMIDDGLFERFPMNVIYGLHNWPGMPEGIFGLRSGPLMASSSSFRVDIKGVGAHAAMPHDGRDPVFVAVQIATALQGIVTRNRNPLSAAVLSITQIHAGDAFNVMPNEAWLGGTVRTLADATLDLIEERMNAVCKPVAAAFGCEVRVQFQRNVPATVNDVDATIFASRVATEVFGERYVAHDIEPTLSAEDFAFMLKAVPGCFAFLGNGDGSHRGSDGGTEPCTLHNPSYDFNDTLLPIGATYFVKLVEAFLRSERSVSERVEISAGLA